MASWKDSHITPLDKMEARRAGIEIWLIAALAGLGCLIAWLTL